MAEKSSSKLVDISMDCLSETERELYMTNLYRQETIRLKALKAQLDSKLRPLGVAPDQLQPETKALLNEAVAICMKTGQDSLLNGKVELAIMAKTREKAQLEAKLPRLRYNVKKLEKEVKSVRPILEALKSIKIPDDSETNPEAVKEFENNIRDLEVKLDEHLSMLNIKPEISHASVMKEFDEVEALNEKLKELVEKLKEYSALPPNLEEARKVVKELQKKLAVEELKFANSVREDASNAAV